jgi:HK97 family phage portal protein
MAFDLDLALARTPEAKALSFHPAWASREPTSTYQPGGASRTDAVLSQREAPRHFEAYGGPQAIDWVYDCIGLYADACSTAPYHLERPDGTKLVRRKSKGTPPDYEVGPADLYSLLDKPNPYMLYDELISLLVIDLLLVGNGYWFKWNPGTPAMALYRLAPSHVRIVPDKYGPKGYKYQPPGARDPIVIRPENIVHFRRPNPHSQYYGMGVIQGAGRAMDLEIALTDTIASYYENKADPSMIVQAERRIPRDVFQKLRAQLRARASGSRNAGELLVLENGLKASSLSTSASDALFEELSKMSRDRIFTKFRASPMLFGLIDQSAGSNRVSDVRREFDNSTLRPFMARLQRQITAALTEAWDVNFFIDHRSILPAEEAIKAAESLAKAPGVKVREIRAAYDWMGLEESTGDSTIDEMVLNLPGEDMDEDGQPLEGDAAFADRPLGSEAGRPPKGENTRAFPAGSQARSPEQKALDALASLEAKIGAKAEDSRLPGEIRPDDTFASARQTDIDSITNSITVELRDAVTELERGLLDTVEGKALKSSDLVSRIRRSPAWVAFRDRVSRILEDGAKQAAASGVMHSGLTPDEDVDYDEIAKTIVHRPEGLRSIIKTLRDRVANRVKEARAADAERPEFEAAVRSAITEWSDSQAVAIADSEATEAYNEATLTVAELSGVGSVFVVEEEDAPDEPCQEARGQVWDIAKARANRKEHPRCRRAFIPLTSERVV